MFDREQKVRVWVKDGVRVVGKSGKIKSVDKDGALVEFKFAGVKRTCFVPANYPDVYDGHSATKVVGVRAGNWVADGVFHPANINWDEESLSAYWLNRTSVQVMDSVSNLGWLKKVLPMIIIILIVAVVVYFVYPYLQEWMRNLN